MLSPETLACARKSMLCWLATVDAQGQPNVSSKENFTKCEPILAPSYRLYPDETTEQAQVTSAMRAYGVQPLVNHH